MTPQDDDVSIPGFAGPRRMSARQARAEGFEVAAHVPDDAQMDVWGTPDKPEPEPEGYSLETLILASAWRIRLP